MNMITGIEIFCIYTPGEWLVITLILQEGNNLSLEMTK